MSESIHGHEVMQLVIHSGKSWTRESLKAEIINRFGLTARFHTCSAQEMDAGGIIDFLEQRGKWIPTDEGFTTSADKVCKH